MVLRKIDQADLRLAHVGFFPALKPEFAASQQYFFCIQVLIEYLFLHLYKFSLVVRKKMFLPHFFAVSKDKWLCVSLMYASRIPTGLLGGQLLSVLFVHECSLPMTLVM